MENRTKNKYAYPVEVTEDVRVAFRESPAHIGSLKNSVDFICKEGTPVLAAADGTVIDLKLSSNSGGVSRELESLGNFIEIRHINEEYSEYEHLKMDRILVKIGDNVKQGQLIGYSGATGWLAHLGPHIHFMVGVYGETDQDYETLEIMWNQK